MCICGSEYADGDQLGAQSHLNCLPSKGNAGEPVAVVSVQGRAFSLGWADTRTNKPFHPEQSPADLLSWKDCGEVQVIRCWQSLNVPTPKLPHCVCPRPMSQRSCAPLAVVIFTAHYCLVWSSSISWNVTHTACFRCSVSFWKNSQSCFFNIYII